MRKREYMERQKARDTHEQFRTKKDVEIPLEDIYFVLTKDGVSTFTNMFENSLRSVVKEEIDKAFRSVASGVMDGMSQIMTDTVNKVMMEEVPVNSFGSFINKQPTPETNVHILKPVVETTDDIPTPTIRGNSTEWSPIEDTILVDSILKGVGEGKTKHSIFTDLTEVIGRSYGAIKYRWHKNYAEKYREQLDKGMSQ